MKRFDKEEEAAIITLMEKGHAIVVFSKAELGPINQVALMEFLFAVGFGAINEVHEGVRCPDCLGQHEEENDHVH
jgi:hypothetical protein